MRSSTGLTRLTVAPSSSKCPHTCFAPCQHSANEPSHITLDGSREGRPNANQDTRLFSEIMTRARDPRYLAARFFSWLSRQPIFFSPLSKTRACGPHALVHEAIGCRALGRSREKRTPKKAFRARTRTRPASMFHRPSRNASCIETVRMLTNSRRAISSDIPQVKLRAGRSEKR